MTITQLETPAPAAQLETSPIAVELLEPPRAELSGSAGAGEFEVSLARRVVEDSWYVLGGLPVAVASFMICLTAFTAGVSLAVVWIGVPLLVFALMQSRRFAARERERAGAVLGVEVAAPVYRTGRLTALITDGQAWRELAHAVLRFIPNAVAVSFVATWWAGVLGGVSFALWGWSLPGDDLPQLLGLSDTYAASIIFYLVAGLLFAVTLPVVVRAAARLEARFALLLLAR
ncbi:sensor domain-containing protein [Actinoplanes sp. Pm04-4]|uniref:Sensor domain-containing protein n=1 Tax=Paractinoplanes pyxinae TaxID=2997416 RepID=A0ABT4B168_9ACTN|nr:sensor domain-containing protein [Actinoplanes pyxinae]MCY1139812.1 sensor domain-containing protein [Actinoplanes pyxinae]